MQESSWEPFTIVHSNGTTHIYDRFARCIAIIDATDHEAVERVIAAWMEEAAAGEGAHISAAQYRPSTGEWTTASIPEDSPFQG